jgi:hypothetical protein
LNTACGQSRTPALAISSDILKNETLKEYLADRSRDLGDLSKLKDDSFLRETFTLPLYVARLKARAKFSTNIRPVVT